MNGATSAAVRRVERLLDVAGVVSLVAMMLVVFVDVVGRNLLNRPLPWSTEVLEVLLALLVFALYPVLALRNGHITVDLLAVSAPVQRVQRLTSALVGGVLFGVIAWCTWRQALRSAGYGDASAILGIPTAWVLAGMTALSLLTVLGFAAALVRDWRGERPTTTTPEH